MKTERNEDRQVKK
jgi:rubrerythrin